MPMAIRVMPAMARRYVSGPGQPHYRPRVHGHADRRSQRDSEAALGDRVELWGQQVSANAVAAGCDTIAYTLFTGITRRVPLHYKT
ncbi:MAG: alanine racemase C-terminal domain-containing protein [Thiolinea sp.]